MSVENIASATILLAFLTLCAGALAESHKAFRVAEKLYFVGFVLTVVGLTVGLFAI